MTRDEIDDRICQIMVEHGPDRHDLLADYMMSLLLVEREACAKIAAKHPGACQQGCDAGEEIAAEIRARK